MADFFQQNEVWIKKAQEVYDLQQKRKMLEAQEAKAIAELKELCGNRNAFGGGFRYEALTRKGNLDYQAIPQLRGVNLDLYRRPNIICWRLTYVGNPGEFE